MDFFVLHPMQHTIFRALAAFVVAPYMIFAGIKHNDPILLIFGTCTALVDMLTFQASLTKIQQIQAAQQQQQQQQQQKAR